jgi:hypothetical protein
MSTMLLRFVSALGLLLALAACDTSNPAPAQNEPTLESVSSLPSPVRVWRDDSRTTRTVLLTIYDDDSATLSIRGPAESVPHWGELHYPERVEHASLVRDGHRTFLIFFASGYAEGYPEVAEIVERPGDHLALWFHHGLDYEAEIVPQLGRLPMAAPSRAVELVLVPEPDRRDQSPDPHTPATHLAPG